MGLYCRKISTLGWVCGAKEKKTLVVQLEVHDNVLKIMAKALLNHIHIEKFKYKGFENEEQKLTGYNFKSSTIGLIL